MGAMLPMVGRVVGPITVIEVKYVPPFCVPERMSNKKAPLLKNLADFSNEFLPIWRSNFLVGRLKVIRSKFVMVNLV